MQKFVGAVFLTGAIVFMASGLPESTAQGKKGPKGTIELIESKDSKFRFTVRDADGKYLASSTVGHATEKEAKEAVDELKKVLANAVYVTKKADK
jgi:hypothetical protein